MGILLGQMLEVTLCDLDLVGGIGTASGGYGIRPRGGQCTTYFGLDTSDGFGAADWHVGILAGRVPSSTL